MNRRCGGGGGGGTPNHADGEPEDGTNNGKFSKEWGAQ
jgi:hypothetical protein